MNLRRFAASSAALFPAVWRLGVVCATLGAVLALPPGTAFGASYVVDTTDDDPTVALTDCAGAAGDCSLRGAMTLANAASSPGDVITFEAGVFSPGTIPIDSPLPALTGGGDTIDGTGATVLIDTTRETGGPDLLFNCLVVSSAGNTVKGLQMTDCAIAISVNLNVSDDNIIGPSNLFYDNTEAIRIGASGASGNSIRGNNLGTTSDGSGLHPNGANGAGITIFGPNNIVGGTSAAERNIVSGSVADGYGIAIITVSATGNIVIGNYVGTSASGLVDLGNTTGVVTNSGAANNRIGGTNPGEGNLISGNSNQNVYLLSGPNSVEGNLIGPDAAGGSALSNGGGVITFAANNTIGPGNVISDNSQGIYIAIGSNNTVKGNLIGTDPTGTSALPNSLDGIRFFDGANLNTVGGMSSQDANVIAFNASDGIEVNGGSTVNNTIRGNSIHSNTGLGINNSSGGNGEPAHAPPVFTSAGSASGTACANCKVDVYSDGADEGRVWHGAVDADGAGNWTYFGPVSGPNISATATNTSGSTSELAAVPCGDFDADTVSSCSDADDDADGFSDEAEAGIALCKNAVNDDSFDGETLFFVNDGCPAIGVPEVNCGGDLDNDLDGFPNDGCPKDGLYSEAEFRIGTGSQDPCGNNGWPLDLNSSGFSANKVDIVDLGTFVTGVRKLNTNPGDAGFSSRWDLVPGSTAPLKFINLTDMAAMVTGATAFPPMLGGAKALGGPACPFAP